MAEPLEEQLLAAIVTALESMTGTRYFGSEYPNIPVVGRDPVLVNGLASFPYLAVYTAGGGYTLGEGEEGLVTTGGGLGYENRFSFFLAGFVQPTPQFSGDTWRLRLRKDALDTIAKLTAPLNTLPQLRSIYPDGDSEFDDGELNGIRLFTQRYRATFDDVLAIP